MGRKNNRSKTDRSNKRRVSFNLSSEHNIHRHSYTSVANGNAKSAYNNRTKSRQTWLQTLLLTGALFVTLPKVVLRTINTYCPKGEKYDSLARERICKVARVALDSYDKHSPFNNFLVEIDDRESASSKQRTSDESSNRPHNGDEKRGVLKRVIDRHRQKRAEKKERRKPSDRQHSLLHHLLEGASTFSHWKQRQKQQQVTIKENKTIEVDWRKWKYAMSDDFQLTSYQNRLIKELAKRVLIKAKIAKSMSAPEEVDSISVLSTKSFSERVDSVAWGGVTNKEVTRWWPSKDKNQNKVSAQSEGARLLAAYLKIMKWPKDLYVKFPFKLCPKGCDSEVAILHTLEWREKYLPWCTSPNGIQYNKAGFIYHRGHSRAGSQQRLDAETTKDTAYLNNIGHTMVWYRPGKASLDDPELYIRTLIYTLEAAVTDSLLRNNGEIGRFNLVIDCEGVGTRSIPSMAYVKKLFAFLQDHFPDRLGVLLLANLSGVGRMVMNMVMPFVTEDVKAKIHVIPAGQEKREEMLTQFIDLEHVPSFIGGEDKYVFDSNEYYRGSIGGSEKCVLSDEKVLEYIKTMPYHA